MAEAGAAGALTAIAPGVVRQPRPDDPRVHGVRAAAVAEPRSVEEAAAVLSAATAEGLSVEPAGSGGRLGWGRPPRRVDILLLSRRLATDSRYEPADLVATVGAGMTHAELARMLDEHGQWLPLDPPGAGTLGATFSQAAAGPLRAGFGTPRSHVLGMEVVTGDGTILRLGGRVVKNVAGYDLVRLLVGSRGTLGFIAGLSLRLRPRPKADAALGFCAPAPEPLLDGVAALREERLEPAALELLSPAAGALCGLRGGGWVLLVRVLGPAAAIEDLSARLRRLLAADPFQLPADVWDALAVAEARSGLVVRLGAPPASLPATLAAAIELAGGCGAGVVAAHAADGIVRVWQADGAPPPDEELARTIREARAEAERSHATLVVARAPTGLRTVDPFGADEPALDLMRELKRRFDPAGVLSPGRFVV